MIFCTGSKLQKHKCQPRDIVIIYLKSEVDHITTIFDRLNGHGSFLACLCWKCQGTKKKKLRRVTPPPVPLKKKLKRCFITSMIQEMIHNKLDPMWLSVRTCTAALGRDLLLQCRDVQINIADVDPIVRDWRIHPHVVRAQQLHVIV